MCLKILKISRLKFKISLLFLGFLFCVKSYSGRLPSPDEPYFKKSFHNQLELIYGESFKQSFPSLSHYSFFMYEKYKTLFSVDPLKKNSLVLVSPRRQISNGLVQIYPLPSIYIYPSPSHLLNKAAINHWFIDALSHEMSHLFQVNAQTKFSHFLSYFTPPYSWFVYPNIYLSDIVLEGNAVLHESIYGTGGRLFSGWARALVFSQLKHGLTLKRILNLYNDPFSSTEKYLHGGYFYAYLHKDYSLLELNQMFNKHSKHIVLPIGIYNLNRLFEKTFKKDFHTLFREYKNFYMPKALKHKTSSSPTLFESHLEFGINSNATDIFLLTSDARSPPQLVVMNKKTRKLKFKKVDMPMGKIFKIKKDYYSSGNGQTDTINHEFALFRDGYIPLEKSRSRQVLDIAKNKTISFDTRQMLDEFRLYENDRFYDAIHSTAILDSEGSIYYFKQNGDTRTLYRNKKALFHFKGYYGFPIEADKSGVYFIASTAYGSSLFSYENGQVFRLSPSDAIVAARKIHRTEFLVSEASPSSYKYKTISTQKTKESPYLYQYSFKKKNMFQDREFLKKLKNNPEKPYSYLPIENLRFKEMISVVSSKALPELNAKILPELYNSLELLSIINFTDPLQKNTISLSGLMSKTKRNAAIAYSSTVHRLSWGFLYKYENGALSLGKDRKIISNLQNLKTEALNELLASLFKKVDQIIYKENKFQLNLYYPLIQRERWKITLLSKGTVGFKQFNQRENWNSYFHNKSYFTFLFNKRYPYAFSSHRKTEFNLFYETLYIKRESKPHVATGVDFTIEQEIGEGLFFSSKGQWTHDLQLQNSTQIFQEQKKATPFNFHSFFLEQQVKDLKRIDFYLKKELNQSLYFIESPLSLRRWAPLIGVSFVDLEKASAPDTSSYIVHSFLGAEFDIALNYKAPVLFGVSGGLVWKWEEQFKKTKPRLHGGFYLKTQF